MRPVRSLLIYAGVVFLGGALLAPWLSWGVQSLAAHLPEFQKLADHPFHRYVNRALLGLALIGLWPLLRSSLAPRALSTQFSALWSDLMPLLAEREATTLALQ